MCTPSMQRSPGDWRGFVPHTSHVVKTTHTEFHLCCREGENRVHIQVAGAFLEIEAGGCSRVQKAVRFARG